MNSQLTGADISTFDDQGNLVNQVMGASAGYAEYLAGYEAADDKAQFNADYFLVQIK